MSTKLKALGLALLATALSAFVVINASADTTEEGDFDTGSTHTIIKGEESGTHFLEFTIEGQQGVRCKKATYEGTTEAETVSTITVAPNWSECFTTGAEGTLFDIDENGCTFKFKVGKAAEGHNTAQLLCPAGGVRITHPNCTVVVPPQTVTGVAYNTTVEGKHSITLVSTVSNVTAHFEEKICVFLGTTHTATMNGSATVKGFDTIGNQVDITATGKG